MRVLVTGSRYWDRPRVIHRVLDGIDLSELAHGGARGADTVAGEWAAARQVPVRVFHAQWRRYGAAAGPIRNREMLTSFQPDLVLAFKDDLDPALASGGTEHMVRLAIAGGVRVEAFDAAGHPHYWLKLRQD